MRLTAIDPEPTAPEKFFRRYSFARAPRLRGTERRSARPSMALRMLVHHHHVTPTEENPT